jgi:hypothetical protein
VNGLLVAADERAAEVDAFQVVFFGLQVGDLADVVTKDLAVSYDLVRGFSYLISRFQDIESSYLIA